MPDCQMCWNEWNTLERVPLPQLPDEVEVCRNCARSIRQTIAFVRFHGVDLTETATPPQSSEPPQPPQPKAGRKDA